MRDGTTGRRSEVVSAVVLNDDHVLMVRRIGTDGLRWHFPGGVVEEGESTKHAVIREVEEETGVVVDPIRCLTRRQHPETGVDLEYWLAGYRDGDAAVLEKDKADRVLWVPAREVERLITSDYAPGVRTFLEKQVERTRTRDLLKLKLARPQA